MILLWVLGFGFRVRGQSPKNSEASTEDVAHENATCAASPLCVDQKIPSLSYYNPPPSLLSLFGIFPTHYSIHQWDFFECSQGGTGGVVLVGGDTCPKRPPQEICLP